MSARYRSTRHPATINRFARPVFLYSAISRIVSTDSCFAGSIKLHVLTTITSASEGCGVSSCPEAVSWPIITSVSTRFFGHPRLTNPIFKNDPDSAKKGTDHSVPLATLLHPKRPTCGQSGLSPFQHYEASKYGSAPTRAFQGTADDNLPQPRIPAPEQFLSRWDA